MERAKESCSKITRLHHVCSVLYNVAKVYIEDRLTKARNGFCVDNSDFDGNRMVNPFLRETSGAINATGNGLLADLNNNNGPFAMPSWPSTFIRTTSATSKESAAEIDSTMNAATRRDPTLLNFVGSGSEVSTSTAPAVTPAITPAAAAVPGMGLAGFGDMGSMNFGPSFGAGADAETSAGANAGIDGGDGGAGGGIKFFNESSLPTMEMRGTPTFGWLPTGQNMVSLLDTDMDVFDL